MYEFRPVTDRIHRIHDRIRERVIQYDAERAMLITESYQAHESMIPAIKRPLATLHVCENMTCLVEPDELFVGNRAAHFCGSGISPEWAGGCWAVGAVHAGQWKLGEDGFYHNPEGEQLKLIISPDDVEKFDSIADYWKTRTINAIAEQWQPQGYENFAATGVASYNPKAPLISLTQGHLTAGFPKVINVGYGAIKKQADDWLDAHEGNLMGEDVEKAIFYRAASISCQAAITMVSR